MTALGKLFRATAFRLALAILALSAVGAGIVLTVIAWQVVTVVDGEMAQTANREQIPTPRGRRGSCRDIQEAS